MLRTWSWPTWKVSSWAAESKSALTLLLFSFFFWGGFGFWKFISSILVWPVPLAQVLPRPQLIFPSKTWFFGIYLNFQLQKSLKIQCLSHSESKPLPNNSIKSCSSKSFCQHQRHIPIPPKFSATIWFNLIFSEEIIQYSRSFAPQVQTSWNQAHAPLLESFPKTPRSRSEASQFGESHKYKTNKLPCFIDRFLVSWVWSVYNIVQVIGFQVIKIWSCLTESLWNRRQNPVDSIDLWLVQSSQMMSFARIPYNI